MRQVVAQRAHFGQEGGLGNFAQHRAAHGAHQRVAVVGAALVAVLKYARGFLGAQGRERHAAANAFAQSHDVWLHAKMLVAEELAQAPYAGLHFVADEQHLVFVAQCANAFHEFGRCRVHAAFALHWLEHKRDGFVGNQRFDRGKIVQLRFGEARHLRRKHHVPTGFAGGRHRGDGAAMKAVLSGDDFKRAVFEFLTPFARELNRAFVRFRA